MIKPPKDYSLFSLIFVFILIPVLGNLMIAIWAIITAPLYFTHEVSQNYREILGGKYHYLNLIATFTTFCIAIALYLLPLFKKILNCLHPTELGDLEKRRLVNAPVIIGLIVLLGWVLSGIVRDTIVFIIEDYNPETSIRLITLGFVYTFLNGSLGFVFFYYLLDYINRKYFIPITFFNSQISQIDGIINLSVRKKFVILLFAIGAFPSIQLFISIQRLYQNNSPIDAHSIYNSSILIFSFTFFMSWLITILMGRSFKEPLAEMRDVAISIGKGNFQNRIEVTSTDDLGVLGETLNRMSIELQEKEVIKDTFGKMVEPEVRDYLLSKKLQLGGEKCNITVLFSDIRGFTSLSEKLPPEEVLTLLNLYFDRMGICIRNEKGLVNKFIGDAILAIFGAPIPTLDHSQRAIQCALQMRKELELLNKENHKRGTPELQIGIGIHTGEVLAGNVGNQNRMEYTVIGDTVNIASRLEGLCKEYKKDLILSESTVQGNESRFKFEYLDKTIVKGKTIPIPIYTIPS
jgi:adenylate cyclase